MPGRENDADKPQHPGNKRSIWSMTCKKKGGAASLFASSPTPLLRTGDREPKLRRIGSSDACSWVQ